MINHQKDTNISLPALSSLPPKKRLDFIINHPTPLKLVRTIPTPDLLMTIREVGAESSLELVEMLNGEQVQELFDLEIWSNDELNIEVAGSYFSLLFEANRDKALNQIQGLDIELIGLMFKLVADIYDTTLNEEPIDYPDLYSTSPDGRFIVCFHDRQGNASLTKGLHTFLEDLYGRDLTFALRLLECVRFELASGLEEESQRHRQNRLLDFGILPREERLEFFSPLAAHDLKRIFSTTPSSWPALSHHLVSPIKTTIDDRFRFLHHALGSCTDATKESFFNGLKHATINMHASLSGDFGDREAIRTVSDYVTYLLELGLFQACKGNLHDAPALLEQTIPKNLIRLGRTALVALRRRLHTKSLDSSYLLGPNFSCADSPLREVARALSLPEPRYYEGLVDPKKLTVRYFGSLSELNATVAAVNELLFRALMMGPQGLGFSHDVCTTHPHLTHANLFARACVNSFFGAKPLADSTSEQIHKLFENHKLTPSFVHHAHEFAHKLEEKLKDIPRDGSSTVSHVLTSVLIQLEQNWRLILG